MLQLNQRKLMDDLLAVLCLLLYLSAPSIRATEWMQLQLSSSTGESKSSIIAVGADGCFILFLFIYKECCFFVFLF